MRRWQAEIAGLQESLLDQINDPTLLASEGLVGIGFGYDDHLPESIAFGLSNLQHDGVIVPGVGSGRTLKEE